MHEMGKVETNQQHFKDKIDRIEDNLDELIFMLQEEERRRRD